MQVEKPIVLDLLDTKAPALSSTDDMPRIETKPDAVAEKKEAPAATPKESPKKEEAKPEEVKTTSESATEHTEEDPGEPAEELQEVKKPPRGVQKRLDELAKREADAVRRAEALQAMLDRELAAKQAPKPEPEKPVSQEDDAPKRPLKTEFVDNPDGYEQAVDDYIAKRASYEATKAVKADRAEQEQQAQQKAIADGNKAVKDAYTGRVEKAKGKYADYHEVAESPDVQVSIPMAHAIMHSEHGPDIAYHLGKNPAEAERISKLSPPLQLVELGLIVASLRAPAKEPVKEPVKEAAKPPVSNAPKPIKPLGAGSEAVSKSPEDESMDEYAARRKKELAAERRPGMRH